MNEFQILLSPRKGNIGIVYCDMSVCGMVKRDNYCLVLFPPHGQLDIKITGVDDV